MLLHLVVTGATGQVGQSLHQLSQTMPSATQHRWTFLSHAHNPLSAPDEVLLTWWQEHRPDYCIIAGAYTAVDRAESEPEAAFAANEQLPRRLAAVCAATGTRLLYLSTDYVFHHLRDTPYSEDDTDFAPQCVYGRSKLAGEQAVRAEHPHGAAIVRTSWVYAPWGHNFVRTILRLASERTQLRIVSDQQGCPTYAPDLADAIWRMIYATDVGSTDPVHWPRTYHYCNSGATTWYHLAKAVVTAANLPCEVIPITTAEYPTPARRPAYSVLATDRIQQLYGVACPRWETSLARCMQLLLPANSES